MADFEQLDTEARHTEDVMLKIRLRQGLPMDQLAAAERERAESLLTARAEDRLVLAESDNLVLTDRGRLLADVVVRELLG